MLAIPVILSMLIGFSGEVSAAERPISEEVGTERIEKEDREVGGYENRENIIQSEQAQEDKRKKKLQDAVSSGDYERFLVLTNDTPFAEIMTELAFNELPLQYQHEKAGFKISPYIDRDSLH